MFILWTIPENPAGQYSCGFLWPWDCFILSEGLEHVKWLKPALGSWAFLRMSSINCLWSSMLKGKPNNFGTPKSVYSVLSLGTCLTGFQIVFKQSSVLEVLQIVAFNWCSKIMAKSWLMTTYLSRRFGAETAGETPRWHLSWASCCWYPANCCHFLVRSGEDMGNMGPVTGALSSLPDHQSIHHPWVLVDLLIYLHRRKHSIFHTPQIKKITKSRFELSETKACRHTFLANESSWLGIEPSFETVSGLFVALTTAVIRGFINTVPENHLASLRKQLDVRVLRRLNTGLSPIHDLSNIDTWQTITALPQKMQALRRVHLLR